MQSIRRMILFGMLSAALLSQVFAQSTGDISNLIPASLLPDGGMTGNFWSAQNPTWPPFPADIYGLPVWDLGGGQYLLDDFEVDFNSFALGHAMDLDFPSSGDGDDSSDGYSPLGFTLPVYTTNDLWLEITNFTYTNHTAYFVIHEPWNDTNLFHDLYYTASLMPPVTWQFVMRCPYTNFFVSDLCLPQGFFRLGPNTNGILTVSTNWTAQQLAQMLVPTGVAITNVSYTGALVARGTFSGGNGCGLPLDSGVIFSTGHITNAIGPNDDNGSTAQNNHSSILLTNGDPDLSNLVGSGTTKDAAVLEFDIISTNAFTLGFQYVFASEEYPEYIGDFNDPMAIFVSTNLSGTNWVNSIANDYALVPGTTNVPVTVNTIDGGCVSGAQDNNGGNPIASNNPQFYVDNHDPDFSAMLPYSVAAPIFNLQYDGMTVLLSVQIPISANVTNHFKIAIADYSDDLYDSAIFIRGWAPCF